MCSLVETELCSFSSGIYNQAIEQKMSAPGIDQESDGKGPGELKVGC